MNWQAVGIGAAVGVILGLAWNTAFGAMIAANPTGYELARWIGYAVGILLDLACGATAGWIAKRRGAVHGALADIVGLVVGLVVGTVMNLSRTGGSLEYLSAPDFWTRWLVMAVPGIGLAAFAGWVAAMLAAARTPAR